MPYNPEQAKKVREGWTKQVQALKNHLRVIKEDLALHLSDLDKGGNPHDSPYVKKKTRLQRRVISVLNCGKKLGSAPVAGFCKNTHLCSGCYKKYSEHLIKMLDEYREKTSRRRLFFYERDEDFRFNVEHIDWDKISKEYFPVFTNRRMQLQKAFRFGMAAMVGISNRIELVSITDRTVAFRMTSLMAFENRTVHSMSPYWEPKTIYSTTPEGYMNHCAFLRFVGCANTESGIRKILKNVHPSRIVMYGKLGKENIENFMEVIDGYQCWNTGGPALHEVAKHKGKYKKKYSGRYYK